MGRGLKVANFKVMGDSVGYLISDGGVLVVKVPLEKARADDPALRKTLDATEEVMDKNHTLLRKLK